MPSVLEMMAGGAAAGVGFVLGAGGILMGAQRLRPMAKQAARSYLVAAERAKEATASLAETMQDIYAEAKAEHEAGMAGSPPCGPAPPA